MELFAVQLDDSSPVIDFDISWCVLSVKLFPHTTQPDSPPTDWASYALANLLQPIAPQKLKNEKILLGNS